MKSVNSRMQIAAIWLALWPVVAHAYVEHGQAVGLVTGFWHPWSGLDHILAMIAVGIWGAQLGEPAIWLSPVTFPMVMAFGSPVGLEYYDKAPFKFDGTIEQAHVAYTR